VDGSRQWRLRRSVSCSAIGTSPLYAMSACFTGPGIAVTPEHVLGVLSLIFWSLVLVILLKYVSVVLNADNKGEGGVLALTALW